jgi:hypothetical protein
VNWQGKTDTWLKNICYTQTDRARRIFEDSLWSALNKDGFARHQCTSILVEPSKLANGVVQAVTKEYTNVRAHSETAIFQCDYDSLPFDIDGKTALSDAGTSSSVVKAENINRLLAETAHRSRRCILSIQSFVFHFDYLNYSTDFVIVKMDVEGVEYDLLPCLARSPHIHLVDYLLLERHDQWVSGKVSCFQF